MGPSPWVPPAVEDRTKREWEPISLRENDKRRVNMPARVHAFGSILASMKLGNVARVVAVVAGCVAAAGSATSTSNQQAQSQQSQASASSPPPSQQMEPMRAMGLWKSTFGAVKIEPDERNGGLQSGNVQGAWMYQRQGQDVVGLFWGSLQGNVLKFKWQEPSSPQSTQPLAGEGYLVFDPAGRQYSGRWWSDRRDRVGEWNGWRNEGGVAGGFEGEPDQGQVGGQGYGQDAYPQDRQQPPYPPAQQQQPYQPQPQPRSYAPAPRKGPAEQAPPQPQAPAQPTYY
jgi:hypothetical protein